MGVNYNNACINMNKPVTVRKEQERKLLCSSLASGLNSDTQNTIAAMNNKSNQTDMDCESGEDAMKNKKYWQDQAGLRGAREQYLELDVRDLGAETRRQAVYINYLKVKLEMANEEIRALKAKQCRCQKEEDLLVPSKPFSSMGL